MIFLDSSSIGGRFLPVGLLVLCLIAGILPGSALDAQIVLVRGVVSGGGGAAGSTGGLTTHGTISQTAAGTAARIDGDLHDAGFWYWAYEPDVVLHVSIPRLEAEVGTRLTVPLRLTIVDPLGRYTPRPFRARIRFNHTLLRPVGGSPACTFETGDCVLDVDGIAREGIVVELEFVAALGDSESTPLTIEAFDVERARDERIATASEHGELRLLGVCREGGVVRLVHTGAVMARVRLWPNPAAGKTTLEYVARESGPVQVRLVDLLGNAVAELAAGTAEAGRLYSLDVDLGRVPSGSYMVVYTTPTQTLTQHLMVTQ